MANEYLIVTIKKKGLMTDEPPARCIIPMKHVLFVNDGDEGKAEVMLVSGTSFALEDTLEDLAGQLGVEGLPKGSIKAVLSLVKGD